MISLLAGKPNPATFPFSSLSVALKPIIPSDPIETLVVESSALEEGLQYGPTAGLGGLVSWLEELQVLRHRREKNPSWRVSVGSGSQVSHVSYPTRGLQLMCGMIGSHQ